jgi:hypothetical protein
LKDNKRERDVVPFSGSWLHLEKRGRRKKVLKCGTNAAQWVETCRSFSRMSTRVRVN